MSDKNCIKAMNVCLDLTYNVFKSRNEVLCDGFGLSLDLTYNVFK